MSKMKVDNDTELQGDRRIDFNFLNLAGIWSDLHT